MGTAVAMIGEKVGMCMQYSERGSVIPLTLIKVENNALLSVRSKEKDGYNALIISGGRIVRPKCLSWPQVCQFKKAGLQPSRVIREFRLSIQFDFEACVSSDAFRFVVGDYLLGTRVDVTAVSQGKGFQGVMKRHGFSGLEASHGVSVSHRSHGSTGQRQDPGKVFKGKKMAGHMGSTVVTVQSLLVHNIDAVNGLIAVVGTIPGHVGSTVLIRDANKHTSQAICHSVNGVSIDKIIQLKG